MDLDGCPLPEDRLYDLEQEVWWMPEPDGTARLGVLSTLAAFAGPMQSVTYRPVEGVQAAGRSVATVESVRYTGAVRLPLAGEVVERNALLSQRPRLLNESPYDSGWLARIRPAAALTAPNLEPAGAVAERLLAQIRERRIRCWPGVPDRELYEIGVECAAILTLLTEELARLPAESHLLLVTDDPTSPIEMVRWSDQTGHSLRARRSEGNLYSFLVRKEAHPEPRVRRRAAASGSA